MKLTSGVAWFCLVAGAGCRAPSLSSSADAGPTTEVTVGATAEVGDPCAELTTRLCHVYGSASEMCELIIERASRFTAQRCAQKLEALEDEVAALDRMQSASLVLASPRQVTGGRPAPALGAKDPRLTLVEFSDFTCSDCMRASPMARMVERLYGDEVRLVFRQFPRSRNPQAQLAAEASLAAHAQGKFWRYHDILFANPHDLSRAALLRYAGEAGLDRAALEAALADGRYRKDVESDLALGRDLFVAGPPALFVDGKRVEVPFGVAELSRLIEDARGGKGTGVAGAEAGQR